MLPVSNEGISADDGVILSGSVLTPGTYLVELEFARPVAEPALLQALERMTFQDVILDESSRAIRTIEDVKTLEATQNWGLENYMSVFPKPTRYRFVAKITTPIQIRDTPLVRWIYLHMSPLDLHSEPADRIPIAPFRLEEGKTYAMRFLSRMKAQKTRSAVCELLACMGFAPLKITGLRRNMRVPGRPNISMTRWYGLGQWKKVLACVTEEDPFIFEDVVEVNRKVNEY